MKYAIALVITGFLFAACTPGSQPAAPPGPTAAPAGLAYLDQLPPLIDRETFFDDPEIASAQISPDGRFISFRRPLDGVMNLWVVERGRDFDEARPVTDDRDRPIWAYYWSRDGRYLLWQQDRGGDENFRVYAVDPGASPASGARVPEPRDLTPYEGIRAMVIARPHQDPRHMLVGINERDPALHDVYRIDIQTGERELVRRNEENVASWTADLAGNLRLGTRQTADGGWEILRVDRGAAEVVYSCTFEESCSPFRYHPDGQRVYLNTNRGTDLSRLVLFDPETGAEEVIDEDPEGEVDLAGVEFSNVTNELLATYYDGDRRRVHAHDEGFARAYEQLRQGLPDGDMFFGSRTADERAWLVTVTSDTDPGATYLFNRETGEAELLYRPRPDLRSDQLAEMRPIRYTARDGLEIPGYLTVPRGVAERDLALVVLPHGGPWARDYWGYDSWAQFLANRGYAVFQPNFRGSTGFGKEFLNLGNDEWGTGSMQHDITDGVQYLIDRGIADPARVAIMGFSYGGYATLAGLAFTPELYAAGVSMVGPSNIITLLNSIPPYWGPMRQIFTTRVGDPDDPADRERLREQSPLFSAQNIRAPLLVYQGANDPRVVKHESDQIVVAMRDLGLPVEYLVAWDEGHSLAVRENRLAVLAETERFLAEHLGGRYQESIGDEVRETLTELQADVDTVRLEPQHGQGAPGGSINSPHSAPPTGDDGDHSAGDRHVVEIDAVDYAFRAPDTIPSGWTTFRFTNEGAEAHYFVPLIILAEGKSYEDYVHDILPILDDAWGALRDGEIDQEGFWERGLDSLRARGLEWPYYEYRGGSGIMAPGHSSEVTLYMEPGVYVLECAVRTESGEFHFSEGMMQELVVSATPSGNSPPAADVEITLANNEMALDGKLTAGIQTVRVHVAEGHGQNVHMVRVGPEMNVDEVVAWLDWLAEGGMRSPSPAKFVGGMHALPEGDTGYFTVELDPGHYVFVYGFTRDSKGVFQEIAVEP